MVVDMGLAVKVRIGQKAPDFRCEAVMHGLVAKVSLGNFIHPLPQPGVANLERPWLILLFVPTAFSFVCQTEVLAFQGCLREFRNRNCTVVFVSTETKHALWHWTHVPSEYGGLGHTDILLLSDPSCRMSRDYGVLDGKAGVKLRGTFVIDGDGILQQITCNDLTVGASVSEVLRLLDISQAMARHVVQYPIHSELGNHEVDINGTSSDPLAMRYKLRPGNEEESFRNLQITDLDAKYGNESSTDFEICTKDLHDRSLDRSATEGSNPSSLVPSSTLSFLSKGAMPLTTHHSTELPSLAPYAASAVEVSRAQTSSTASLSQSKVHDQDEIAFSTQVLPPAPRQKNPRPSIQNRSNTYRSRRGSCVVLEFAEPILSGPSIAPYAQPEQTSEQRATSPSPHANIGIKSALSLDPASSRRGAVQLSPDHTLEIRGHEALNGGGRTRLQASLIALKKIGSGLRSPWSENGSSRGEKQGYFE